MRAVVDTSGDGAYDDAQMATPPLRVLVVDDDPTFRSLVCQLLEDKGYAAVAAGDDDEAVGQASSGQFTVAVLDLVMPGAGGLELADRVRTVSPDTQVLILTGQPDMESGGSQSPTSGGMSQPGGSGSESGSDDMSTGGGWGQPGGQSDDMGQSGDVGQTGGSDELEGKKEEEQGVTGG